VIHFDVEKQFCTGTKRPCRCSSLDEAEYFLLRAEEKDESEFYWETNAIEEEPHLRWRIPGTTL